MNQASNEATELYAGREQTLVKHFILEHYLERFAHIVGSAWNAITYVDCFSGPWNVQSDKLEDSSFAIALKQLRAARENLADLKSARNRPQLELRCFFLEKKPDSYAQLREYTDSVTDAEIETRNAELEESIEDIHSFVRRRRDAFPFVFVDPTGWKGFSLNVISPLLRLNPVEVLINFMTGHIVRFAESSDVAIQKTFDSLFGTIPYRNRILNLAGRDREDELVRCYMDAIREAGGFKHVCAAFVLHPEKDRTYFHLIYATRNLKGVEVFKQVERRAMEVMEQARSDAQKLRRESKTGQAEFSFDGPAACSGPHYEQLRDRYLKAAQNHVCMLLAERKRLLFDDAWVGALQFPLVWDHDVKDWIKKWKDDGRIRLEGLSSSERVPKREKGHWLVLAGNAQAANNE